MRSEKELMREVNRLRKKKSDYIKTFISRIAVGDYDYDLYWKLVKTDMALDIFTWLLKEKKDFIAQLKDTVKGKKDEVNI